MSSELQASSCKERQKPGFDFGGSPTPLGHSPLKRGSYISIFEALWSYIFCGSGGSTAICRFSVISRSDDRSYRRIACRHTLTSRESSWDFVFYS